jgi:hypothetical protein
MALATAVAVRLVQRGRALSALPACSVCPSLLGSEVSLARPPCLICRAGVTRPSQNAQGAGAAGADARAAAQVLRNLPFLRALPPTFLDSLLSRGTMLKFDRGQARPCPAPRGKGRSRCGDLRAAALPACLQAPPMPCTHPGTASR